jgi:rRNA-processing protein CGR1
MDRKRNHIKERRDRQEQRLRMEQMAAKMSAKKLQRLQKVSFTLT